MTKPTQYIGMLVFLLACLAGAAVALRDCGDKPNISRQTTDSAYSITQYPPTLEAPRPVTLTIYRDTGSIKWRTHTLTVHDTVPGGVDSFFRELPPFSITGDRFISSKQDTITATFEHPANLMHYMVRYSPDTALTVTKKEYILPSPLQFGAQAGVGAAVGFDGVIRPGIYVGVGLTYRF